MLKKNKKICQCQFFGKNPNFWQFFFTFKWQFSGGSGMMDNGHLGDNLQTSHVHFQAFKETRHLSHYSWIKARTKITIGQITEVDGVLDTP